MCRPSQTPTWVSYSKGGSDSRSNPEIRSFQLIPFHLLSRASSRVVVFQDGLMDSVDPRYFGEPENYRLPRYGRSQGSTALLSDRDPTRMDGLSLEQLSLWFTPSQHVGSGTAITARTSEPARTYLPPGFSVQPSAPGNRFH